MNTRQNRARRGSSLIEFTLAGVPLIFVLISVFSLANAMWAYHGVAYAVKEATRYTIVHGANCTAAPNTCGVTIANIAAVIHNSTPALAADQLNVTLTPATGSSTTGTLANLLQNHTAWPPTGSNAIAQRVTISAVYSCSSMIAMFWPGTRPQDASGTVYLSASSTEEIQF